MYIFCPISVPNVTAWLILGLSNYTNRWPHTVIQIISRASRAAWTKIRGVIEIFWSILTIKLHHISNNSGLMETKDHYIVLFWFNSLINSVNTCLWKYLTSRATQNYLVDRMQPADWKGTIYTKEAGLVTIDSRSWFTTCFQLHKKYCTQIRWQEGV